MKISQRGLDLIKQFEGLKLTAYLCPAGVPTIGYGSTAGVKHSDVGKLTITRAQAESRLLKDLRVYEKGVLAACTREPNQHEFDAFVCFAYNIGVAGFAGSTTCRAHNRGDREAAARAFGLWNKATVNGKKQVLAGLTRRRAAESALYLEPVEDEISDRVTTGEMPQCVEPERPMQTSQIVRASTVAGGTAALATAAEVIDTTNSIKAGVQGLEAWLIPLLLLLVVGLCGFIIWERLQQRKGGWA